MAYDVNKMLADGYSIDEIGTAMDYDVEQMRADGFSDEDITTAFTSYESPKKQEVNIQDVQLETIQPGEEVPQTPFQMPAEPEGLVQPTDVTATEPRTLGLGEGNITDQTGLQYRTEDEFNIERDRLVSEAQAKATESTFTQEVVDPKTGETIEVDPEGLQTDLPVLIGKLATVRFITPEMEKAFGLQAANMLSKEAQYILSRNPDGLGMDEAAQLLANVPKEEQAITLANRLGHETTGLIKQSLVTDADRILLGNELKARRDKLLDAIGPVDVKHAKAKYADMVEEIAGDYHNTRDASPMLRDLDFLEKFYGTTPSKANSIINQMKTVIEDNPKINLTEALEFRADLNYLLSKSKRGKESVKLNTIKENLDNFIGSVATPQQMQLIDEAVTTYSRTLNNHELVKLISKSGDKQKRSVDWVKLDEKLAESNLKSPEVDMSINIVKEFSERFKNDIDLVKSTVAKGTNPDASGALGTMSYVISRLKDTFALWGERHNNLKIQNAIVKSIRNSKTPLDFVDEIAKNKSVPKGMAESLTKIIKQIEYKPGEATLFATEKGTVSKGASEGIMRERADELISDFMKTANVGDDVVAKAKDVVNSNRLQNIATTVSKKMKADDAEGNINMLKKIVTSEAEMLIKEISRQTGVKLPKSEADKIIRMKLDELGYKLKEKDNEKTN